VAIGQGSIASAANTVSVGTPTARRRIVNVAPGTQPNDAVTFAQLQAATAAVAPSSVTAPSAADAGMRQEVRALRALVTQLQARIAQLERRVVADAGAAE
jgi:autotransporter adhesin